MLFMIYIATCMPSYCPGSLPSLHYSTSADQLPTVVKYWNVLSEISYEWKIGALSILYFTITSTCSQSAPKSTMRLHSSASRAKSLERIDGEMMAGGLSYPSVRFGRETRVILSLDLVARQTTDWR